MTAFLYCIMLTLYIYCYVNNKQKEPNMTSFTAHFKNELNHSFEGVSLKKFVLGDSNDYGLGEVKLAFSIIGGVAGGLCGMALYSVAPLAIALIAGASLSAMGVEVATRVKPELKEKLWHPIEALGWVGFSPAVIAACITQGVLHTAMSVVESGVKIIADLLVAGGKAFSGQELHESKEQTAPAVVAPPSPAMQSPPSPVATASITAKFDQAIAPLPANNSQPAVAAEEPQNLRKYL